jgi:hypothetical protein
MSGTVSPPRRSRGGNNGTNSIELSSTHEIVVVDLPQTSALSYTDDKSRWWGKLWGTNPNHDDDHDDETSAQYQSLEAPHDLPNRTAFVSSAISNATVTVEDRLKQDCSFFYQGIEEPPQSSHRGGLQPLASALQQSRLLLSTADGDRFRAKYQRLNQDVVPMESDDLFLDEYTRTQQKRNTDVIDFASRVNTSQNTGKLSTLFFEQDGRLLMKLPRDQVRLIMDPSLEPGIISVEQWRKVDHEIFDPVGPAIGDEEEGLMVVLDDPESYTTSSRRTKQLPGLRYVMTVPDDLYRRVVAEMSHALMPPWYGCFLCCSESEGRADIKLALAVLSVIFFIMIISTLERPAD